jgi:glycosyltransferase involved in cell wall biosynthesis
MASRLPVVASPVGDIPEVISDGENGFLLRNSSAEELATKLMAVKELSARARDEMGRKERAVVEARYQISTHTGAWLALYEALANRR